MKKTLSFVTVLLIICVSIHSYGATYYVSEDGSNNWSGLYDTPQGDPPTDGPWRYIKTAAETLVAGDTVYIKEGLYHEQVIPQNSGSTGNYITYAAYPGDSVTIDGKGFPITWGEGLFDIDGKRYIKVSGLRIINSSYFGACIKGNSDHIIIENNYMYNCQSSGIHVSYYGDNTITNIIVDGNEITETNMNLQQEGISLCSVDTFEIKNNHVHHIYKEGIDAKVGCSNGKIYKNCVHHLYTPLVACGIYVDASYAPGYNIDVFQNTVYEADEGISLATESGGTLENIKVYNNICYNSIKGFGIGSYIEHTPEGSHFKKNITVINNTFHDNNIGIFITEYGEYLEDFTIRNNIISGDDWYLLNIRYLIEENFNIDHNLFSGNSEVYGNDYIVAQPRFVNPSEGDFHLREGSPAIDRGSDVNAPGEDFDGNSRPQRAGYDIGAYEFQNYTNPFNPRTKITYILAGSSYVTLTIYDLLGREIQTLVSENQGPGIYKVVWDGEVNEGYREANGIYFYLLKVNNEVVETGKLILLR